jgi:hypothetical protein
MSQPKPKTHGQLQRIFGLAKPLNCGKQDLEELAYEISEGRVERLSLLSFDEANAMIGRLGGEPFGELARRTVNHRRQKAGIPQIATRRHLKLLYDLADRRGISEDGLGRLCRRMIQKTKPRTSAEANKIIEAIKAMNKRDEQSAAVSVSTSSTMGRAA